MSTCKQPSWGLNRYLGLVEEATFVEVWTSDQGCMAYRLTDAITGEVTTGTGSAVDVLTGIFEVEDATNVAEALAR